MLLFLGSQKGGLGRDRFCDDHVLGPMAPEKRMEPGPRGPWGLGQADGLMVLREDFFFKLEHARNLHMRIESMQYLMATLNR